MTKRVRHRFEYVATLVVGWVVCRMTWGASLWLGAILGEIAFSLFRLRRDVSLRNLRGAFPEKSWVELIRIGRRAYHNIGRSFIEYIRLPALTREEMASHLTTYGFQWLDHVQRCGQGAILVGGHLGSWELMGVTIALAGYPVDFVVREQSNRLVDALMNRQRCRMGIGVIPRSGAARRIIKAIRSNRMVAMLADQDAGRSGTLVEFLGRPSSTPKGPAALALRTKAPVIVGVILRERGARQRLIIEKPLSIPGSHDREEDIRDLTQIYTRRLEEYVRSHPDHWFWPHRRWKSAGG